MLLCLRLKSKRSITMGATCSSVLAALPAREEAQAPLAGAPGTAASLNCDSANEVTRAAPAELQTWRSTVNGPPRRPRRIVIVRHGQSMGNVDEAVYTHTPDWKVALTETGVELSQPSACREI